MTPNMVGKLARKRTSFIREVGPREGLLSCRPLPERGKTFNISFPPFVERLCTIRADGKTNIRVSYDSCNIPDRGTVVEPASSR